MKELLLKRKSKFIQYMIATFMFIVDHFAQIALFALIFGAIEGGDLQHYKKVAIITIAYIIYSPFNFLISRLLRIRYMRDTILDVRKLAFDKIINMPFKQYSQKSKEVYISNLINDVNSFENKFFLSLLNYLINMGMFIISIIFLMIFDLKLAFGMLLFSILLYLLSSLFTKKTTALEKEISETNEAFASLDMERAREIEKTILNLKDMTVINVSHIIFNDTKALYDQVLTVKKTLSS